MSHLVPLAMLLLSRPVVYLVLLSPPAAHPHASATQRDVVRVIQEELASLPSFSFVILALHYYKI